MKSTWQGFFWAGLILVNCHLSAQTVRTATATASTFNGFVVGVTVDDGGCRVTIDPQLAAMVRTVMSGAKRYEVV